MCRSTAEGGRRCSGQHDTRKQSASRSDRRRRARTRIAAMPSAPLVTVGATLAGRVGRDEREAALAEATKRSGALAEWFVLAGSTDPEERVAAAALPITDARAVAGQRALAFDYDPRVRRALAQNPECDAYVIRELAHDPDAVVSERAAATMSARGIFPSNAPGLAAIDFYGRITTTLDDTPHAAVTRAAMKRPGWVSPEHANDLLIAAAAEHDVRVTIHPGTIPGATGVIEIDTLRTSTKGTGQGTAALRAMHALADQHGWALALRPSGDLGGDVERLRGWYAREGYAPAHDSERRVHRPRAEWIRYPKGQDNV